MRKLRVLKKITLATIIFILLSAFYVERVAAEQPNEPEKNFVESFLCVLKQNTLWVENYEYGAWDCTNQSAALYVILENMGFKPKIITKKFTE